jgi:hypothetical protein
MVHLVTLVCAGARPVVKANITHDREQLIVKGNEFHYLAVNGFCLLSCPAEMFLRFQMTARSTQQTLWARLGMLC